MQIFGLNNFHQRDQLEQLFKENNLKNSVTT
jgi:hypothetical protein